MKEVQGSAYTPSPFSFRKQLIGDVTKFTRNCGNIKAKSACIFKAEEGKKKKPAPIRQALIKANMILRMI